MSGPPIVVDLDGTLTPTDTLVESTLKAVRQAPANLLRLPLWLMKGRAGFKARVAECAGIDAATLPYNEPLLAYLREQKADGRRLILASAAHHSIVDRVAAHLGLFDHSIATRDAGNLKGVVKLHAIREAVGEDFSYAGDSPADLPIWREASSAILVGASRGTAAAARKLTEVEREFPGPRIEATTLLSALRVHQWLKNLLLFVPLMTAFAFFDPAKLLSALFAFLAFSFVASATYIVNDVLDIEADRRHPSKRHRVFAAARMPIPQGLALSAALLVAGLLIAAGVSTPFLLTLIVYLAVTSAYTWALKGYVLIDVIILSLLYALRILAGGVALDVPISAWLLAFSVFMFFSLALIKRCGELVALERLGETAARGRDYRVSDLAILWPIGTSSAVASIVIFGLFINDPDTQQRYQTPELLWLAALALIYWQTRLWVKTSRSEMHDDPVVYSIRDRGSRLTILAVAAIVLAAHFIGI